MYLSSFHHKFAVFNQMEISGVSDRYSGKVKVETGKIFLPFEMPQPVVVVSAHHQHGKGGGDASGDRSR